MKTDALTMIKPIKRSGSKKRDKWPLKEGEQLAYFYVDGVSLAINDSLNRLSKIKAEAKKQQKIRDAKLKDSLKIVNEKSIPIEKNESLLPISRTKKDEKETIRLVLEPIMLDSANVSSGKSLNLSMIQFEVNSANFKEEAVLQLNALLRSLRKRPTMEIEIRGHTDNSGGFQHNLDLSISRAEAVSKFLQKNGISSKRLQTYGYGSSQPLESNETEEGKAMNRRIEIFILHE